MLARSLIAAGFLLSLAACVTTAPEQEASAEQYICADPLAAEAKGGQMECQAWYVDFRFTDAGEDVCREATSEQDCAGLLENLETTGFSLNTTLACMNDKAIAAYRQRGEAARLSDAALRAGCP